MDSNFYVFRSEWSLEARVDDVYVALAALLQYPAWWPEVRSVRGVTEDSCEVVCRSLLPYDLVFTSSHRRRDPDARILEAALAGDLEGFSRWTITPTPDGCVAVFDEEVIARKALLRRLGRIARPVFEANHALMMRHGRRGLRTFVAGVGLGRGGP